MILAIGVKLGSNLWLVPYYGIAGAALGTSIAFLAMAAFNFNRLDQIIPLGMLRFRHYGRLVKTVAPMGVILLGLNVMALDGLTHRLDALIWLVFMLVLGAGIYVWRLWKEQILTIEEWEMIPFGGRLINLLEKKEN
jgi:PST family polysaccharide transporter